MARLPWWRIVLLLVAAVALVWWFKHRVRHNPYGSQVHVATVAVAPYGGPGEAYRILLGEKQVWIVTWEVAGESTAAKATRQAQVDAAFQALGEAARAFRREHPGFDRAEIRVAAEHRGVVPFALTARVLSTLLAAGYDEVEFESRGDSPAGG